MKLFHTFTGAVLILLACNTKSEEKKSENWEHFVENTNENVSVETPKTNKMEQGSIYTFKVKDLSGNEFDFATLKGKKILIVNTASKCGYTPQYEGLEKVYEQYKDKLVIIGFPCNQFGGQEAGTNEEIAQFCKVNFGVTFPLMKKSSVIKSETQNEVFKWLTDSTKNGWNGKQPSWNFSKYLVNEEGILTHYFDPSVSPTSEQVLKEIEQ